MKYIPLLLLSSCLELSEHNVTFDEERIPLESLDKGVEVLAYELDKAGLIDYQDAIDIIDRGFLVVEKKHGPFMCGKVLAVGCLMGNHISLTFDESDNGCIAKTAYLHELTHWLLCNYSAPLFDCDNSHDKKTEWWTIADHTGAKEFAKWECIKYDQGVLK